MKIKKNKIKKGLGYILIFALGALIALYPTISNLYYTIDNAKEIKSYQEAVARLDSEEIERRKELARIDNSTLDTSKLADPYGEDEKKEALAEYAKMLEVKEKIGFIEVPRIGQDLALYAGTSEEVLQKAVGHLEGTSLPVGGQSTHIVLTAHRGLPSAKLFTDLDKMVKGDIFYIHSLDEVLAYKVDQVLTVEPTDFEPVLVVEGKDYATLLTCTPYMVNSHRLLVRGERIDYTPPADEAIIGANDIESYKAYLLGAGLVILILVYLIYKYRKKIKKLRQS